MAKSKLYRGYMLAGIGMMCESSIHLARRKKFEWEEWILLRFFSAQCENRAIPTVPG